MKNLFTLYLTVHIVATTAFCGTLNFETIKGKWESNSGEKKYFYFLDDSECLIEYEGKGTFFSVAFQIDDNDGIKIFIPPNEKKKTESVIYKGTVKIVGESSEWKIRSFDGQDQRFSMSRLNTDEKFEIPTNFKEIEK